MKRIILAILLFAAPSFAAQQQVGPVTSPSSGKWTISDVITNRINPHLAAADENFDELYSFRPWVIQSTAPADTTLLWFDDDQVAGYLVLKVHDGSTWVQQAIGEGGSYTLPVATASVLGGVKQGTGVSIAGDGALSVTAAGIGLGTSDNPSFASVHASGGNLAAANKQVTKAWQTGLSYTANVTSVIHGGQHYICTSSHTAGASTEPGVGASWETAWSVASSGSMTYPGAGVANSTGSAWGTSYTVGTSANNLIQLNSSGELPFTIDLSDITDTTNILAGKAGVSCFASEAAFNACFDLTWSDGGSVDDTAYGSSWDGVADEAPSKNAVFDKIEALSLGGVTVQESDPTSSSAVGWYAATGSGDIFYKSAAGLFTIAGSYVADPVAPTLTSRVIGTNGTTLTLTGSASLSVGAGGNGGFDVDCSASGSGITATYASGAPGTDLVYTLGTTVNSGDTCDLDYTQPGNGIEATTGGADLASITSAAITNNSTQSTAELLRPNSDVSPAWTDPDGGSFYTNISDQSNATYIYTETGYSLATFGLSDHTGSGTISGVRIHIVAMVDTGSTQIRPSLRIGGTSYSATDANVNTGSYAEITTASWATNPATSSAWTDSDLDGLGIQIGARGLSGQTLSAAEVWVEVIR